ncbi:tRNA (adenosine(37)-N6)-threonylcarbamoyltransferase complex ATPase subunit type 1 TsaE [Candidatus Saccharibacteria bacterium]|nr:tRNA (adenosine(37)-N6)-threonylcarbamoyltransferase complex ATPase subunit type 1 TsaE [Candidatus Saccharibacteria bacterium]
MSTEKTWQMHSTSSADTEAFGERIGAQLLGGEVIELVSDLGGGKTTFVRGLVRGAGSTDTVSSPTFTISKEYSAPRFTIAHFDFYRLAEAGIVAEELREYIHSESVVTIIEWSDIVHDVLPLKRLRISIQYAGETERDILCEYTS